jgi:simple sugar transport system substrate-binding protein
MQLDGMEIGAGTDLGIPGYESLIAEGNVLYGNAQVYVTAADADQYPF